MNWFLAVTAYIICFGIGISGGVYLAMHHHPLLAILVFLITSSLRVSVGGKK
jgi:hypothetical protein